jgi:hypothetical protein
VTLDRCAQFVRTAASVIVVALTLLFAATVVEARTTGKGRLNALVVELLDTLGITTGGVYTPPSEAQTIAGVTTNAVVRTVDSDGSLDVAAITSILDEFVGNSRGSLIKRGASEWAEFAVGGADDILKVDGSGLDISWGPASIPAAENLTQTLSQGDTTSGQNMTVSAGDVFSLADVTSRSIAVFNDDGQLTNDSLNQAADDQGGLTIASGDTLSVAGVTTRSIAVFQDDGTLTNDSLNQAADDQGGLTIASGDTLSVAALTSNVLLRTIGSSGQVSNDSVSDLLDEFLGSTRGQLLRRGASAWEVVSVGADNTVISSDGTDPGYETLTSLMDAAFGSTQGNILHRNGSGWTVLAPGTSGQVLESGGAGANVAWGTDDGAVVGTSIYGELYFSTPATTSLSAATPAKAAGTTTAGDLSMFTHSNNRLTYTGASSVLVHVVAAFSVTNQTGGSSATTHYIAKNGSELTETAIGRDVSSTAEGAMATVALVSLAQNDYIELWHETDDGDDLQIESGTITIESYGELALGPYTTSDKTTDYTVLSADNGTVFTNIGAAGTVTFTLPAGTEGQKFTFKRVASQEVRIDPNAADHLVYSGGAMADGEYLRLTTDGSCVTVIVNSAADAMTVMEVGTLVEETP